MKRFWDADELAEHFTLTAADWELIANKTAETRLGFAILLKYLPYEGAFPKHTADVPPPVIAAIAKQVGVAAEKFDQYSFTSRTHRDHRSQIRDALHYRASTEQDLKDLSTWLVAHLRPEDHYTDTAKAAARDHLHTLRIEPPSAKQVRRAIKSARHTAEEQLADRVADRLTPSMKQALDDLLHTTPLQRNEEALDDDDAATMCQNPAARLQTKQRAEPRSSTSSNAIPVEPA